MQYVINETESQMIGKIISAILPRESNDKETNRAIKDLTNEFLQMLSEGELYGASFCFYKIFKNTLYVTVFRKAYSGILTKEIFESACSGAVDDLLTNPQFDAERFFSENGQVFQLKVQSDYNKASDFLYSRLLELYDEYYSNNVSVEEAVSTLANLKLSLLQSKQAMITSMLAKCLQSNGVWYNKKKYCGTDDWIKLNQLLTKELETKLALTEQSNNDTNCFILDSSRSARVYDSEYAVNKKPSWFTRIPPIDALSPIRTGDILTIVSTEGFGKTSLLQQLIYNALMQGKNVLYMVGEMPISFMKHRIESMHIYTQTQDENGYGLCIPVELLSDPSLQIVETVDGGIDEQKTNELRSVINALVSDLYDNPAYGKLIFTKSIPYVGFADYIERNKREYDFEVVALDHMGNLNDKINNTGYGKITDQMTLISTVMREEASLCDKKDFDIEFINLSHKDRTAYNEEAKGRELSGPRITAGSGDISKYSTMLWEIQSNVDLKDNDEICIKVRKSRFEQEYTTPIILKRFGPGRVHKYLDELQTNAIDENSDIDDLIEGV